MRAMSDKSSLPPDLPGAWTGTAPDADALFARAEAASATKPDVFKPHREGVELPIEEYADDETHAWLDIEHPYDLTGPYEGSPVTRREGRREGKECAGRLGSREYRE